MTIINCVNSVKASLLNIVRTPLKKTLISSSTRDIMMKRDNKANVKKEHFQNAFTSGFLYISAYSPKNSL